MRARLFTSCALALLLPLGGCESMTRLVMTASELDWKGQQRIELPLAPDDGGRPAVVVRALDRDITAVVDTGTNFSAMSRVVATGIGASDKKGKVRRLQVQLGTASIELSPMSTFDNSNGPQMLLGQSIYLQAVVDIDFDAGKLTLIHPDAFTPPAEAPLPVKSWKATPTVRARVNGGKAETCVMLDTGYNGGLAFKSKVASRLALPFHERGGTSTVVDVTGKRYEVPTLAPLQELNIAGQSYRNVRAAVIPKDIGRCGNLLGMAFLSRYHLVFDLANRRLWLLPRSGGEAAARGGPPASQ